VIHFISDSRVLQAARCEWNTQNPRASPKLFIVFNRFNSLFYFLLVLILFDMQRLRTFLVITLYIIQYSLHSTCKTCMCIIYYIMYARIHIHS